MFFVWHMDENKFTHDEFSNWKNLNETLTPSLLQLRSKTGNQRDDVNCTK